MWIDELDRVRSQNARYSSSQWYWSIYDRKKVYCDLVG